MSDTYENISRWKLVRPQLRNNSYSILPVSLHQWIIKSALFWEENIEPIPSQSLHLLDQDLLCQDQTSIFMPKLLMHSE